MKKILSLALCLVLILSLTACGGGIRETEEPRGTGPTAETVTGKGPEEGVEYPAITQNVTRADIQAIPVADASMTEDQLREICVRYMTLMQSVVWTPDAAFSYACETAAGADSRGNINIAAGVRYGGMPYFKAAQDLDGFLDYLDPETGILRVSQFKSNAGQIFGNHCSTSAYWAWARISSALIPTGDSRVLPSHGFTFLSPCELKEDLQQMTADRDTRWICDSNGEQTMYRAYANFKPASGMIYWKDGTTGHMRMAVALPTVVKNADGSINGAESFVLVNEQVSTADAERTGDGPIQQIGKNQKKYTFTQLFASGYVPFEIPELCGKAAVQEATAELKMDGEGMDAFLKGQAVSNYFISRMDVTFKKDGSVVYANGAQGYGIDTSSDGNKPRTMDVKTAVSSGSLTRNLKKGETYDVTVTVRLANGVTKTVFEGALSY